MSPAPAPTPASTFTPLSLLSLPDKSALVDAFVGKDISALRTPALIVDRTRFRQNCERVTSQAEKRGMRFRAHVKSESARPTLRCRCRESSGVSNC